MSSTEELAQKLLMRFGLSSFHPWQLEAIEPLLTEARQVLVVAPTGGGKSLCYQFPATELQGTTIVVSPLIALMEDQVRGLREFGIEATWLSSTLGASERRSRLRDLMAGRYKLVYIAPERLSKAGMLEALAKLNPPLVAIDEAHCISQWGHDFRPDYLRLRDVLETLRPPRVLACTATATPLVRDEIVKLLGLSREETTVVLRGFARPNLHLGVEEIDKSTQRRKVMLAALHRTLESPSSPAGAAIIYASTRRNTERVAAAVAKEGFRVEAYHAGLEAEHRARVNQRFAEGDLDVVVATNAFGMGIDRADIRAVIHIQAPGSIEEYYQEVGRAGRDGQPAHGLLIASSSDFGLRRRLIEYGGGGADGGAADPDYVARQWKLFLDLMRYVEAGSCRHDFILKYFGDESETLGGCGHCDVCERLEELGAAAGDRSVSEKDALVVRKALSAVARSHGRVGLNAVADMLSGVENKQQRRLGFTSLSTFGLLSDRPRPWIQALLRRLMTAGLVDITGDDYPLLSMTAPGAEVMKGETPVQVLPPPARAGRPKRKKGEKPGRAATTSLESLSATEIDLFERLREVRRGFAESRGVPPYVVCHDRTLVEIASRRPMTMEQLAAIHGMGPARLTAYGESLLAAVADS